jgi:hypothetical protein
MEDWELRINHYLAHGQALPAAELAPRRG